MFLKFWGVKPDGEYISKKGQPRPGWSYRYARRNAARVAQWPGRWRWRRVLAALKAALAKRSGAVPA